jgi:hypothetical protein
MTDRLTLTRALEEGGIPRDAAEHDNVATKADLESVEAAVRSDLKAEVAAVRADLALVEHRLLSRLGGMIVAATGILAAIHYLH